LKGLYISLEVSFACHYTDRGSNNFGTNQYRKVSERLVVHTNGQSQDGLELKLCAATKWLKKCLQVHITVNNILSSVFSVFETTVILIMSAYYCVI
jgi:hypothetical protein